jgi:DNA-binding response OmpR family regulator
VIKPRENTEETHRILVVDDKLDTRVLLRELLAGKGYQVDTAESADVAQERIIVSPPDLVLLDVVMPGKSGYELCRELKADPKTRFIPVIMITGLSDRDDRVRGIEAGAEDFLSKPLYPEELFARVKVLLHLKRLTDQFAKTPATIEFYSCFISYSSKDHEIAEQLYLDLLNKGIKCWFAPEDLKIGDRLRLALDQAIRIHDKLMVLLSESSVGSQWVEKEVETAFERERLENRVVLFPIRLDDTVMNTDQPWAADIRRTRHIGDFRDWQNHDSYKKAFQRLLRDLKAQG